MPTWPTALCVLFVGMATSRAEESVTLPVPEPVAWEKWFELRAGAGYSDNVLLSPAGRQGSHFATLGLDAGLIRLAEGGPAFSLLISGDDRRYLDEVAVDREEFWMAVAKLELNSNPPWEESFALQYLFQDQMVDVSAAESELSTIRLSAHSLKATPAVAHRISTFSRVRLEVPVSRQFPADLLDGHWEWGPRVSLERTYGYKSRSAFSLVYGFTTRDYDLRTETDLAGAPRPATSLQTSRHELEVFNRHYWDAGLRWRLESRLSWGRNLESGSGYYDYDRGRIAETLRFAGDRWEFQTSARAAYSRYPNQAADPPSDARRDLLALAVSARVEHKFAHGWKAFSEFSEERNLSNRALHQYRLRTVLLGLSWEN